MVNPYPIQIVGLVMTAIGLLALAALATIYGRPLSNEEKLRAGKKSKNIFRHRSILKQLFQQQYYLGVLPYLTGQTLIFVLLSPTGRQIYPARSWQQLCANSTT